MRTAAACVFVALKQETLIKKRREKIAEVLLMQAVYTYAILRQCCNADVVQDSVLPYPLEVAIFNCVVKHIDIITMSFFSLAKFYK